MVPTSPGLNVSVIQIYFTSLVLFATSCFQMLCVFNNFRYFFLPKLCSSLIFQPPRPSSLSWSPKYLFYLLNDNNVRCLKILEIYSTASQMTKHGLYPCTISGSCWMQWDRAVSLAVTPIELDPNGGWPEGSNIRHCTGKPKPLGIRPSDQFLFALKMLFLLVLFLGGAATAEKNK